MPSETRVGPPPPTASPAALGPRGPFPDAPMGGGLERRWLHYAFLTAEGDWGLVANASWLGSSRSHPHLRPRHTSILLLYERRGGWRATQYNAVTQEPLWSSFRDPCPVGSTGPYRVRSASGELGVDLRLRRTSRPCTSQCAPFAGDHHLRWQSETGVRARGEWWFDGERRPAVDALGYHERVRGSWGWPELGGWVFGFTNQPGEGEAAPEMGVVFTLIQPVTGADATGSVMLWRRGRLVRHFPRRCVGVAVRGELERDRVSQVPAMSNLFGVPPMQAIPRRLLVSARMGRDRVVLDFLAEAAARVVVPSETGLRPFSVHEVVGPCLVEGTLDGRSLAFESHGIVEFAGGARVD